MKGLVKYDFGPGNAELRELPVPEPGAGEVRIKVLKAGICGSDMHVYHYDSDASTSWVRALRATSWGRRSPRRSAWAWTKPASTARTASRTCASIAAPSGM